MRICLEVSELLVGKKDAGVDCVGKMFPVY